MRIKYRLILFATSVCLSFPSYVYAHSGGTDSDGCHNDNINGGYHCHNSKSSSSAGGGAIVLGILVAGATYWYLTTQDRDSQKNYGLEQSNNGKERFNLSLSPTSATSIDGVRLQVSYEF